MSTGMTPNQRTLRLASILSFPPAFIMLIIHGIVGGGPFPAVSIFPLAISALLALYLLKPNAVTTGGNAFQLSRGPIAMIDLSLAIWLLTMCVLCWVNVPRYRYDGGQIMLGTYGSVWVMLNW